MSLNEHRELWELDVDSSLGTSKDMDNCSKLSSTVWESSIFNLCTKEIIKDLKFGW